VFGEVEFVSSIIKTLVIVGLMLVCLIIDLGGGPKGDRLGFRYWRDPGAFAAYKLQGPTGRFLGWWACMVNAGFVYMGTEMVGLTFGEAGKPWKVVPKAIRQTAWRISFLYIGGILVLGMVVPYNSPGLIAATKQKTGASKCRLAMSNDLLANHSLHRCLAIHRGHQRGGYPYPNGPHQRLLARLCT